MNLPLEAESRCIKAADRLVEVIASIIEADLNGGALDEPAARQASMQASVLLSRATRDAFTLGTQYGKSLPEGDVDEETFVAIAGQARPELGQIGGAALHFARDYIQLGLAGGLLEPNSARDLENQVGEQLFNLLLYCLRVGLDYA